MRLLKADGDRFALLKGPYRQSVVAVVIEVLLLGLIAVLGHVKWAVRLDRCTRNFLANV